MTAEEPPQAGHAKLQEAILDEPTLDRLFSDLELDGELLEIVYKGAPEEHAAEPGASELAKARAALRERRVFGVQLRYLHGDIEWWDTLMVVPQGVRLVRINRSQLLDET